MSESLELEILVRESISAEVKTLKALGLKTRARETPPASDVREGGFSGFKDAYGER